MSLPPIFIILKSRLGGEYYGRYAYKNFTKDVKF